jgi:hypothetical protein
MPSFPVGNGVTDAAPKTVSNNDTGTIAAGGTLAAATIPVTSVPRHGASILPVRSPQAALRSSITPTLT